MSFELSAEEQLIVQAVRELAGGPNGRVTYWPLLRLIKTAPVSREMILNYIGEHVLGLPRSY